MKDSSEIEVTDEALPLAQLMFRQYREWMDHDRLKRELSPREFHEREVALGDAALAEKVTQRPPDEVTWFHLSRLMEVDPEKGWASWQSIKEAAWQEWASGHRSAAAFKIASSPYERAQFLALRASLLEEWQPRNGIERSLIEMMAQTYAMYLFWFERLSVQSSQKAHEMDEEIKAAGYWLPPRISTSQALEQSAAMCDRFHRLYVRSLRALRDLRRYSVPVRIEHAGQVNVGGQQINMSQKA
jgi:hypothetical protein